MPLCIGKKACDRARCKKRCEGWFSGMPDVLDGCKSVCSSGNTSFDKSQFLCSGSMYDQAAFISLYKFDPCPGDEITFESVADPLNTYERDQEKQKQQMPIYLGVGIIVVIALIVLYLTKK